MEKDAKYVKPRPKAFYFCLWTLTIVVDRVLQRACGQIVALRIHCVPSPVLARCLHFGSIGSTGSLRTWLCVR